jgi:hypothetical protein
MPKRIKGTSARGLSLLRPFLEDGVRYRLALNTAEIGAERLSSVGCPQPFTDGMSFLPSAAGKHSTTNSHASEVLDKTGDKEIVYRMVYSSWNDWRGNPHSGIVSRPYKRWPRIITPPREELLHIQDVDGYRYLCSSICTYITKEEARNTHILNLFLELFGEFDLFDDRGRTLLAPKVRRVNWDLLPQGDFPWARAESHIATVTKHLSVEDQTVIHFRLRQIAGFSPDIIALGRGGFSGYFAFGFFKRQTFILESTELDNATYVFGSNWEQLSQLTKKAILCDNLQKDRIVHDKRWKGLLTKVFK